MLLIEVLAEEILDLVVGLVDLTVPLECDVRELCTQLNLLGRNIVLIPCSHVQEGDVILMLLRDVDILKRFLGLPRAMIQVLKAHVLYGSTRQEYAIGVQVCTDNAILMEQLHQVHNLNGYLYSLKLRKQCLFILLLAIVLCEVRHGRGVLVLNGTAG